MKKFAIHPASVILWLWLLIVLGPLQALAYVLAILVHESGHALVARRLGYRLSRFSISPYGVELAYFGQNLDLSHEVKIALAGPVFNLFSCILMFALWWLFPITYFFTADFVNVSMILALLNLLPAYPLDGGRIFVGICSRVMDGKTAKKITIALNVLLSVVFFALFFVFLFVNFNPTYLLFAVFLVMGVLDLRFVTKFERINIFCKDFKNFVKPVVVCVDESVKLKDLVAKIQLSRTFLFEVILKNGRVVTLSEKMVVKMATRFGLNASVEQVLSELSNMSKFLN